MINKEENLIKENRLYVTLPIEANNDGKGDKIICYNLKEYKYNYIDDPNFWYRKNRFELEYCECCNADLDNEGFFIHQKIIKERILALEKYDWKKDIKYMVVF